MLALLPFLLIPLMFLNFFGGVISGVWLAILGDWTVIIVGFIGLFFSSFFLSFALLPSIALGVPGALLAERKRYLFAVPFIFISNFYVTALISVWCLCVFWYFMSDATHQNFFPRLFWSYGSALGPWMYMAQREAKFSDGGTEAISIFCAQIAYITIGLVVIFSRVTLLKLAVIFSSIMAIGLLVQFGYAILIFREQHRFREAEFD